MNNRDKIFKYGLAVFLAILAIGIYQASENPQSALEKSNLQKAQYCMNILENRSDLEPSNRIEILRNECIGETYIQHTPYVEDGREALLNLFAKRYKNRPETSMSVKRTAAKGDLVWLHIHVKATPDSLGAAAIHIFRMKNGKFVEHWGVVQPVPEESLNDNTMF